MRRASGLHLHTSNRLEALFADLAALIGRPSGSILQPEIIVTQSVGMGRWLSLRLAETHGICANVQFLFPQKFVFDVLRAASPEVPEENAFDRAVMTWRILQLLPSLLENQAFESVRHYLSGERVALKSYQLAEKIAHVFDQYLAFRPRMILDWDAGQERHWQAILWRELSRASGGQHPPALARRFSDSLGRKAPRLPERVAFFGISSLPEFYVQFLQTLSRQTELHLFIMRPTPEWWSDIRSPREELRARRKREDAAQLDLAFERGNPLLASLGKLGREFLNTITELDPTEEHARFELPAGDTALAQIQRDIFELHDPTGAAPRPIGPADRSLQIHSCHSPMREMEVLHDQLLALFDQHPDLKPHQIVVMAPDINVYAPFIEAVFDTAPEQLRIPFSIADRGVRAENGVIDTFLRILESAESRFPASSVLNILESVPLQKNFALAAPDLEIIRNWIEKTGIRWGIDAAHRAALGLPEFGENSWRAGLDRLLLGYAAPACGEQLFAGILAYDEVEGNLAETLGRFAEFAQALFATARQLAHPRTLLEWQDVLRQIATRFFSADDEGESERHRLRRVIDSLGKTAGLSGFAEMVSLDVLIAHLEQALARTESGAGFLVGRVTFCALKPMRAVPFRVVCLVGMNDTAYPRPDRAPTFDLIGQDRRPGDRSTRDDDRYLFLEALLSARDLLYISYLGRSMRDNSPLPPSVLVSELLDYTRVTVTEHPLQPFNAEYFRGDLKLFSYSAENCAASQAATSERSAPPPFITTMISEPEADWRQIEAAQLIRFFGNPAKFFIEQRLGVRLPRLENLLDDSEPLEIGQLPKYHLQQALLACALRGEPLEPLLPAIRANGELPPGRAGEARLRDLCQAAEEFAALVRQHFDQGPDEPRSIRLALGEFAISAQLDKLHRGRQVHYRLTTRKPKDLLGTWIYHLLANSEADTESILITADKQNHPVLERFPPIEKRDATKRLHELLEFYWRGLREPLPLFPRSSLAFVEQMIKPRGQRSPLEVAQAKWRRSPEPWEPDKGEKPEADDPFLRLAFRHIADPLDEPWQQLALAIFAPPVKELRS